MARPRHTNPALVAAAAQQAHAEYDPQIRGVRRETRGQVKSIRTEGPALEASLENSADALRHAGLSARDRQIALTELAHKIADAGASTALQTSQVQQDAHSQIVDLLQSRGQAQGSALTTLLHEAAVHQQDIHDEKAAETRGFKSDILKAETEKALGLGSYAAGGSNSSGLTPTQERDHAQSKHNAAFYAHQLISASKDGVKDPKTGEQVIPPNPAHWNESIWNQLTEKIAGEKGVNSVTDAEHAVQAVRDHFQPETHPLDALRKVAAVAAPALAPKALQPIAQFAGALLGR